MFVQTISWSFFSSEYNHIEFWRCTEIYYFEIVKVLNRSNYAFSGSLLSGSKNFKVLLLLTDTVKFYFTGSFLSCKDESMIFTTRNFKGLQLQLFKSTHFGGLKHTVNILR